VLKSKRTEECGTSGASEERLERKRGIRNEMAAVISHAFLLVEYWEQRPTNEPLSSRIRGRGVSSLEIAMKLTELMARN
jgi:hypothetical protein